jgi:hypothetical protein
LRLTLKGPVICQSAAVAPSVPLTCTTLQNVSQVMGAFTDSDTGTNSPFGLRLLGEALMLEFAKGNEYGAKDAGGFGN